MARRRDACSIPTAPACLRRIICCSSGREAAAQAFDTQRLALEGSPIQVADGVFGRPGESLTLSAGAASFAFRAGDARFERHSRGSIARAS